MSNNECWPNKNDWVHRDPNAIVENIFRENSEQLRTEGGAADRLDATSHERMEKYLDERMHLKPEISVERTEITHQELVAKRKFWPNFVGWLRGWRGQESFSPKRALIATVAGLALVNLAGNADNIVAGATNIYHHLFPRAPITETRFLPGIPTQKELDVQIGTVNEQDKVQVISGDIDHALDDIQVVVDETENAGGTVQAIEMDLTGGASDEVGSQNSLGQPDAYNADLAERRANAIQTALTDEATLRNLPMEVNITAKEYVLTPDEISKLNNLAQTNGFESGYAAVQAAADGAQIDGELGAMISEYFTDTRGASGTVTITSEMPGDAIPYPVEIPNPWPEEPYNPHLYPFLALPIPRLRRGWKQVLVQKTEVLENKSLSEWLRVYEEGLETAPDRNGIERTYLREYPWQWTRKFQHLLRDDRIKQILRGDYRDSKNQAKSLRVMFVDHEPTTETVTAFQALLEDASLVQDGRLGGKISAIFVYPKEYAGREPDSPEEPHKHPKKIALGIDTQMQANVLGINMPVMELVEMHMPTTPTEKELREFYGAAHTLAHELLGHGSDVADERIILDPVNGQGATPSLGRYASRNAWADRGKDVLDKYPSLNDESRREFIAETPDDVSAPSKDEQRGMSGARRASTDKKTISWRIRALNHRPKRARLESHLPTKYSGASSAEAYAESVAMVATGIKIPFAEAIDTDISSGTIQLPAGYHVASEIEETAQRELGAKNVEYKLEFAKEPNIVFYQTSVDEDPLLGNIYRDDFVATAGLAERAKWRKVPAPEEMYEIRAGLTA